MILMITANMMMKMMMMNMMLSVPLDPKGCDVLIVMITAGDAEDA